MRRSLLLFLLTVAIGFAYSPVQVGPNTCYHAPGGGTVVGDDAPFTCAYPNPVGAGNILVIGVELRMSGTATGVLSLSDTLGNPLLANLVAASPYPGTTGSLSLLYVVKTTLGGSDTVSVRPNGTYFWGWLTIAEYDGTQLSATTAGVKSDSKVGAAGQQPACGAFTPTAANVQVIAAVYHNDNNNTPLLPWDWVTNTQLMTAQVTGHNATERQALLEDYFMATATSINPGGKDGVAQSHFACAAVALQSVSAPAAPTLTSIAPNTGAAGNTVPVTLTGTNLTGATSISAGSGITVSGLSVTNATTVTASFAISVGATTGAQSVTITTPAGTSGAVTFTITPAARRRQPIQSTIYPVGVPRNSDFSLIWLADQHPNSSGEVFQSTTKAYVVSKKTPWNIQGIFFTGDVIAMGESLPGFGTHGWNALVALGLPIIASQGNHDCNPTGLYGSPMEDCRPRDTVMVSELWDQYVGYQMIAGKSYGPVLAFSGVGADLGVYTDSMGAKVNHAIRFAVNGHKFLAIALEIFPRQAAMDWANALAAHYPDHQVIWVNHAYLSPFGIPCTAATVYCAGNGAYSFPLTPPYTTGQVMLDSLFKPLANSFIAIGGHFPDANPNYYSRYDATGTHGNTIYGFYFDYQNSLAGTNDAVGRFVFHESTQKFDFYLMHATDDSVIVSYTGMDWPQL